MKIKKENPPRLQATSTWEAGIDLFRILGLLFVNGLHACLYNGFYNRPQIGGAMWVANTMRWLFYGCNAMFMLTVRGLG